MILSYIPFRQQLDSQRSELDGSSQSTNSSSDASCCSSDCHSENSGSTPPEKPSLKSRKTREGLYNSSMGKHFTDKQRSLNTEQITRFIKCAFADKASLNLDEFIRFNSSVTSEMLLAVMSCLEERLPCSVFYFREREQFKIELIN